MHTNLWNDNRLEISISGEYAHHNISDVAFHLNNDIEFDQPEQWTQLVDLTDCYGDDDLIEKAIKALHINLETDGRKATAFIIDRNNLSNCLSSYELASNATNGVRIFYDREVAENWLMHQEMLHRKISLH